MSNNYSDLEVVPREENPKYLVSSSHQVKEDDGLQEAYPEKYEPIQQDMDTPQRQLKQKRKRMCGLPVKIFWIVVVIAVIVVIAAGVGGGVGGSLSGKHIKEIANSQSSSATTAAPTDSSVAAKTSAPLTTSTSSGTPTASEVIITTSTTQSAEYTLLVDCPSSNWTVYTPPGTSQMFRKICQNALLNDNGIDAVINTPTTDLDSCIQLCAAYNVQNATEINSGTSDICNAVCWRDTIENNDWPGHCCGYSTRNGTNTFILTDDTRCAGAALINQ